MRRALTRGDVTRRAFGFFAAAALLQFARGKHSGAHLCGMAAAAAVLSPTLLPNCGWWGPVAKRFPATRREVWLTIDDGPDPRDTPEILEVLASHGATATFFGIGRKVDRYPELARAIVAAGHGLENHTWSHPAFSFWAATPSLARREIEEGGQSIFQATGKLPTLFRAPAGLANGWVHRAAARSGLRMIGWSAAGRDGVPHDPDRVVERISANLQPGAIVLLHEGPVPGLRRGVRAQTLARVLENMRERKLKTRPPPGGGAGSARV